MILSMDTIKILRDRNNQNHYYTHYQNIIKTD